MRQIAVNLIGNAVKFTENGAVNVAVERKDNHVHVIVKDTGIGLNEEQLSHIFGSFAQGDNSLRRKYGGTGLGLTISQKFAQMHNGKIYVESEYGVGSTFILIIPFAQREQQ